MQLVRYADSYRTGSEDRAEIVETPNGVVLIVADGVGGQAGGGAAADFVVEHLREIIPQMTNLEDPKAWYSVVKSLDGELLLDDDMGQTTLIVAAVTPWRIVGASVGDSEAWLVQPEGHFDLTGGQKRKPYLGSGAEVTAFSLKRPRRGTLLVATDGLFKYAPAERILDTASHPELEHAAENLADLARLPSGKLPDDLALVLCRFDPEGLGPVERLKEWLAPTLGTRRVREGEGNGH